MTATRGLSQNTIHILDSSDLRRGSKYIIPKVQAKANFNVGRVKEKKRKTLRKKRQIILRDKRKLQLKSNHRY